MKFNINDLNKLKAFLFVYQTNSVLRASERLAVTAPAVSIAIKKLEQDLAVSLFTRVGNKFIATQNADQLYQLTHHFFDELNELTNQFNLAKKEISGTLRIGAPMSFGAGQLPKVAGEFKMSYPLVDFEFSLGSPKKLIPLLLKGKLDFVITGNSRALAGNSQISGQRLFNYQLALVASKSFYGKSIVGKHSYQHISQLSHASLKETKGTLAGWYQKNFAKTPNFNISIYTDNIFSLIESVKNSFGLATIPVELIANELSSGELIEVAPPKGRIVYEFYLVQLNNKVPLVSEKLFIKFLSQSAKKF